MKQLARKASLLMTMLVGAAVGSLVSVQTAQGAHDGAARPGYCTVDCSSCSSTLECQGRGAGSCTQIKACHASAQP
ncbi:MAG: hypothetical protein ABW123_00280 [Cystobacter sp.]